MFRSERPSRRILHLTSNYPRWAGDTTTPFVHNLAAGMVERGWESRCWHLTFRVRHADELMDGVRVHRFRYFFPSLRRRCATEAARLANLRSDRTARYKVPALVAAEWASAVALRRKCDLLHAHWMLPQGFVAATTTSRAPYVLTVHGSDLFTLRGKRLDHFSRIAVRRAAKVTVGSSAARESVTSLAGSPDHIELIPFGVDIRRQPNLDNESTACAVSSRQMEARWSCFLVGLWRRRACSTPSPP